MSKYISGNTTEVKMLPLDIVVRCDNFSKNTVSRTKID